MAAELTALEWWPVTDSKSRNTVAWAYDRDEKRVYVIFQGKGTFAPYNYVDVSSETVDLVRKSGYVSKAISHEIKDTHEYCRMAQITNLPYSTSR